MRLVAFAWNSPLPLSEVTILAASVGFVGGYYGLASLARDSSPSFQQPRARAVELGTYGARLLSGLVAASPRRLWQSSGWTTRTQILWLVAGIRGVAIVGLDLDPEGWRDLMPAARAAAGRMAADGAVEVTQGGVVVDVATARGPRPHPAATGC